MSYIITKSVKSRGIAVLLVFFFGPLGLFYSTAFGAVIMSFVVGPLIIWAAFASSGLALILLPLYVISYIVWAVESVNSYNRRIKHEAAIYNKQMYNPHPSESISKPIMDKESQKWEKRQELQKLEDLSKSDNIDEHEYRNKKENIEKEILALNVEPTPLNTYRTEEIYEEPKSNKIIYLLSFLLLATFMYLLYDKDSNSLKLDRITSIFTNRSSKEKEEIKVQLEKTYFDILNGKYTAQNMSGGVEMPFYNTNLSSLVVMGLGPLATFTGNLKMEPSNLNVYEIDETNSTAKIKYDLKVITKENSTTGSIDMDIKKVGGQWKFDAEKFFSSNTLETDNSKIKDQAVKNNLQNTADLKLDRQGNSNSLMGKTINLPANRHYSIFYIDTQNDLPFDEILIIGDTLYFNRDIYDEQGEAIDKRVITKVYLIKNFNYGFLDGSKQKLRNNRHFSLYKSNGTEKVAEVDIDGTSSNDRNETIYEWGIRWVDKSDEIFKTYLDTPNGQPSNHSNDLIF